MTAAPSLLVGVPSAYQYAVARAQCRFVRLWLDREPGATSGPRVVEECGLCGEAFVVGWFDRSHSEPYALVSATELWSVIHEHAADHLVGIA